jgi:uncharacterized membrane protein YeaQ/YmgE (transglycosylase-associated protein family)
MTDCRTHHFAGDKESAMGIAWITLGMAAALLANLLLPGKRSRGLIFICLACFTGALGGGWAAQTTLGSVLAREQAAARPLSLAGGPLPPSAAASNGAAVS